MSGNVYQASAPHGANHHNAASTKTLTGVAILGAVVVVLTILCNYVKFGPFSITLALAPIIIGAAVYGVKSGAILGFVFSLVVAITGALGMDGGTVLYLMSQNAVATIAIILLKGTLAGWLSGLCYYWLKDRNQFAAVLVAGIVCPVVNTGLFLAGMFTFFYSTLTAWTGTNAVISIIAAMTGINFLIELAVNIVLSSTIVRIIRAAKR